MCTFFGAEREKKKKKKKADKRKGAEKDNIT